MSIRLFHYRGRAGRRSLCGFTCRRFSWASIRSTSRLSSAGNGRNAVVIANAMDDAPDADAPRRVERELAALTDLGFDAAELDLRDYIGQEQRLRRDLARVDLAWLRDGNVFMLRFALFRSGGDVVFRDLLAADALVYAGYSAGGPVLSSTLQGLEVVNDVRRGPMRIYGSEPVWDGLALLKEAFVPRYRSPGHPETAAMELVTARYQAAGVGYPARARRAGVAHQRHGYRDCVAPPSARKWMGSRGDGCGGAPGKCRSRPGRWLCQTATTLRSRSGS